VASDPQGGFVVVWDRNTVGGGGSGTGIFARRFDGSGDPIGGDFQVNSYVTGDQGSPDVRLDTEGNFIFVWWATDFGARDSIFGQRYDAGGIPLGEEFRISLNTTITERDPEVASTGDGSFVVVWETETSLDGVFGQRFDSSGYPVGGEFQVNSTPGAENPDLSSDEEGNFVVVYDRLRGRAFAPDGTPLGGEFPIKSSAARFVSAPSVAFDAVGNFVVGWSDADAHLDGIFVRRFAGPGLALTVDGSCPGPVIADVSSAPPNSEVALIPAANTNGFTKGGALCPGSELAIGEPFQLPPTFVIVDGSGNGSRELVLGPDRCHIQALAFATCETSNVVAVP
jgi:hypothetical protein